MVQWSWSIMFCGIFYALIPAWHSKASVELNGVQKCLICKYWNCSVLWTALYLIHKLDAGDGHFILWLLKLLFYYIPAHSYCMWNLLLHGLLGCDCVGSLSVQLCIHSFMYYHFMIFQTTLLCSLVITLITSIFNYVMYLHVMTLQITSCCSLIITLITVMSNSFMYSNFMTLQITLLCSSIITLITVTFNCFMYNNFLTSNYLVV